MCSKCKDATSDAFVRGMATIMWASAWADHVEEHGCYNLSGCEITEVMPEIPEVAWRMAERLAGMVEQDNMLNLAALYAQAMKHTGRELTHEDYWTSEGHDSAERFGQCIAYAAMGAGVSWEDDNPEFQIRDGLNEPRYMAVPSYDTSDLRFHADDTCEHGCDHDDCSESEECHG